MVISNPKFTLLNFFLFVSVISFAQKKFENTRFFNDTTVLADGYSIELKSTYTENSHFIWTTAVITNTTDKYLLLDKDSISVTTKLRKGVPSRFHRTIVVPPYETIRFPLKFKSKDNESQLLTFNFKGITVTDQLTVEYAKTQIPLKLDNVTKLGDLKLTVLKVVLKEEGLAVRLRVQYAGTNFLKQNVYAISLFSPSNASCFNFRKYKGVTFISPNSKNELLWLVFPRDCALETKASKRELVFADVFTEYSTKPIPEVKVSVSYKRGE
jgi:hypothetical protein